MLQAASSEGGKHMMDKGYSLPVGTQSIVGYVAAKKNYRIALDVGADAVLFENADLPATHSEIALPSDHPKQSSGSFGYSIRSIAGIQRG